MKDKDDKEKERRKQEAPDPKKVIEETRNEMEKSLNVLRAELAALRSERASPTILDGVKVESYGKDYPLKQIAALSVQDAVTLIVQPYDPSLLQSIEKAILLQMKDVTTSSDGKVVRVKIPPLTEERRKEIVKIAKRKGEDFKVSIRNIRQASRDKVKEAKDVGKISEDVQRRSFNEIQKITDEFIKKIDETVTKKEKEILGVSK